jgi:IS5 family transposase
MIIAIFVSHGSMHDFNMWKKSVGFRVVKRVKIQADSGYQGIKNYHANSETPKKKSKKRPLTKEDKANNRRIGSERVVIEHVNAWLKRFHIFVERYRNRHRRFKLRMSLICGLYNFELAC